MHRDTIDRLKHWLSLAESDRSLGDERGAQAKLMLARAEIESALGLGKGARIAQVVEAAFPLKLTFKYATAGALLIVAAFLVVYSQFAARTDSVVGGGIADTATRAVETPPDAAVSAGSDGGATDGHRELALAGAEIGALIAPPEGRVDVRNGLGAGLSRHAPSRSGSSTGAAAASVQSPAEVEAETAPPVEPVPASIVEVEAAKEALPAEEKKQLSLDPLSLIVALDSHFE